MGLEPAKSGMLVSDSTDCARQIYIVFALKSVYIQLTDYVTHMTDDSENFPL